jgi:YVTN family beta-propeller protein
MCCGCTRSVVAIAHGKVLGRARGGAGLLALLPALAGAQNLYVANTNGNTLAVVDIGTNTVVDTIKVGKRPFAAAVTPDNTRLYVANFQSGSVSVVNTIVNKVIATVPLVHKGTVNAVAVSADGETVYAVGTGKTGGFLWTIATATNKLTKTVNLAPKPSFPGAIALNPADSTKLYVSDEVAQTVLVLDTTNLDAPPTSITSGTLLLSPFGMAVSPDGSTLYVANVDTTALSGIAVIDTSTNAVSGISGSAGIAESNITLSPDGDTAYVSGNAEESGCVTVIQNLNTTPSVLQGPGSDGNCTIFTGGLEFPQGAVLSPDGATLYTALLGDFAHHPTGELALVDASNNSWDQTTAIALPKFSGAAVSPQALVRPPVAYVASSSGKISVINTVTQTVATTLSGGADPDAIALNQGRSFLAVASASGGSVSLIATATGKPLGKFKVGKDPAAVAVTPDGSKVFVANAGTTAAPGSTVSVITVATKAVAPVTVGTGPDAVVITPDGVVAYVANGGSGTVTPIAIADLSPGTPITVGTTPDALAVTPDGATVFVANFGDGTVTPITTGTQSAGALITVGQGPAGLAMSPDGKTLYVANETDARSRWSTSAAAR